MKKMHLFLIFSLSLTIAFVLLKDQWTATQSQAISNQKRVSITFILGNDEKSTNSFYAHASYFYNMNDDHKTDYVVHSCKTLNDVLNYLKNQHNGFCYSTINLVAHGNPWQGLRLPIDKDLPRASAVHLKNALDSGMLKPLCTTKIDGGTTINVVSCAVGNNDLFVEMLEQLFFCPENNSHPTIHCEKFYVNFSNNQQYTRSSLYFIVSKYDQHNPVVFISGLKNKYPATHINWEAAYSNPCSRDAGMPYRYHFKMLVDWKVSLDPHTVKPKLDTDANIMEWLKTQDFAIDELNQMQLKIEDLHWFCLPDPNDANLVKIKGYCHIEGVMVDHKPETTSAVLASL
jgi:hypothetical protein